MLDINLLNTQSTVASIKSNSSKWLLGLVSVVFLAFLILYSYLAFDGWRIGKNQTDVKIAITDHQADLKDNKQRHQLLTRQGQLNNTNQLIEKHAYWSGFLPELARITLVSAKYTTIDTSVDGKINVTVTLPSYTEAEKYLQVFNLPEYNRYFSNVTVMALTKAQKDNKLEVIMRLRLDLNPELLKK